MTDAAVARDLVSIMMPACNAERFLLRAIDSVLAQDLPTWELIVVDDGSTDGTARIAGAFGDPRITVIRQDNRGEAASRNVALGRARGEYLAFLDADDLFLPHHLAATVGYLRAHPEHAGVYTDGMYVTEEGEPLAKLSSRRPPPKVGRLFDDVVRASNVLGPPVSVVLRVEPIRRHGLRFDEGIVIGPDWDFFRQVAEAGHFGYVDAVTCLYRIHSMNISVRTGRDRRQADTARCRANAVRSAGFDGCALDVRTWVFHDLLINQIGDAPAEQRAVLGWKQFRSLPAREQARLLRLMAGDAILRGSDHEIVREWLLRWRGLDGRDVRGRLLCWLYGRSRRICRLVLKARRVRQATGPIEDPFRDLRPSNALSAQRRL